MSRSKGSSGLASTQSARSSSKNVVVFGESGVGKSSLINLIAGRPIAVTSSSAKGCTFRHRKYELQLDGTQYAFWDTAGLDEGSHGTVPAEIAEQNLKSLLRDLTRANGIHLLVYCIRASRLRQSLLSNYNLFYSAICRKKVPIVTVVTGLENYEEQMEDWWVASETEFAALKMHFDGHACVTTLNIDKVNSPALKQRCHASRQAVLALIARACARDRWGAEQDSWVAAAVADVRAMYKPTRQNGSQPTPIVALYDVPDRARDPIGSVKDVSPFEGGRLMNLGGFPLVVYRIHDRQLRAGPRFKKQVSPRNADLLIVCASVHSNPDDARRRAAAFYGSYGGDTRPLLIVVWDAVSDQAANEWWNASDGDDSLKDVVHAEHYHLHHLHNHDPPHRHHDLHLDHDHPEDAGKVHAIVRALPPREHADAPAAFAKITRVIQTRALQPVDVMPTGCFGWLTGGRRPLPLRSAGTASMFPDEDCLTRADIWVPWKPHRP